MISRIATYIFPGIPVFLLLIVGVVSVYASILGFAGVFFGDKPNFGELSLFGTLLILFAANLLGLVLLGITAPFFVSILLELRLIKHCKSKKIELASFRFKHPYSCRELHTYTTDVSNAWIAAKAGKELDYFVLALQRIANVGFFSLIIIFGLAMIYSLLSKT